LFVIYEFDVGRPGGLVSGPIVHVGLGLCIKCNAADERHIGTTLDVLIV